MTLEYYLSLFPGAAREKARFMALAGAVLRQAADMIPLTAQLQSGFSFASAEGLQLDALAASVGLGRESGMPVGMQLIGKALADKTVLNAGHAFQMLTDYHKQFAEVK